MQNFFPFNTALSPCAHACTYQQPRSGPCPFDPPHIVAWWYSCCRSGAQHDAAHTARSASYWAARATAILANDCSSRSTRNASCEGNSKRPNHQSKSHTHIDDVQLNGFGMSFSFKGEVDLFTDCMVLQIWVDISDLLVENKPGVGSLGTIPIPNNENHSGLSLPDIPTDESERYALVFSKSLYSNRAVPHAADPSVRPKNTRNHRDRSWLPSE